jgi:hypothetical protein
MVGAAPAPNGTPGASHGPEPGASAGAIPVRPIAAARRVTDRAVAIEAIVTAPATLLDSTGRRIVVQDNSGAIEVLIPTGTVAPPVGSRVHLEGRIGVAYGAPRLKADRLDTAGSGPIPAALVLHGPPGEANEWRLATISGRVDSVHKLGDRWRADLRVGSVLVAIVGQPGSGIPSTALVEGRDATLTGIVRRPFPTATDRRFAITPRFPADIRTAAGGGQPTDDGHPDGSAGAPGAGATGDGTNGSAAPSGAVDADLADLAAFTGQLVRVGGLVVDLTPDGFTLDDGTAVGAWFSSAPLDGLGLIEPDDALNAIGGWRRPRTASSWSWMRPAASSWPPTRSRPRRRDRANRS